MSSTPQPSTPIALHIPQSLQHLNVPLSTFLTRNPRYQNLAVGACIFFPASPQHSSPSSSLTPQPPRLLLVQRSGSEYAFPNLWEIPGGSSEPSDPTVLHSVAREVFEETGLLVCRFNSLVGKGVEFVTGTGANEKLWLKLTFEVEVIEIPSHNTHGGSMSNPSGMKLEDVKIRLDPEEHQRYAWVAEEEIQKTKEDGGYETVTEEQREVMVGAFEGWNGARKQRFLPLTEVGAVRK